MVEEMSLPDAQWRRLDRMRNERHFLLDATVVSSVVATLSVSGSTGNVYTVTINNQTKEITCNCPDYNSGAEREEVVCKHCCFAIYRIFRSSLRESFFENNHQRKFSAEDLIVYHRKVAHLQRTALQSRINEPFVSSNVTKRYRSLKEDEDEPKIKREEKKDDGKDFGVELVQDCQKTDLEDCCGMCYEEFKEAKPTDSLVRCGECKKLLHQECADMWLRKKVDSCVYCRSWLAYSAYFEQREQKTKKPRAHISTYLNISENE